MSRQSFATYWKGAELSAFEKACLLSFVNRGHQVQVFSYGAIKNLPAGIRCVDAREIVAETWADSFSFRGKPDVTHFTDYFRYNLFLKTDCIWIDTDIVLLDRAVPPEGFVIGWEDEGSLCGAIMRIPSRDEKLPQLVRDCAAFAGKPLVWGDTGPRLLNAVYGAKAVAEVAAPRSRYYPIHYFDFWKVLDPASAADCAHETRDAVTLHLWNNLLVKLGVYKNLGPPRGSFLHGAFERAGCIDLFDDFYPAPVMATLIDNFLSRVDAGPYAGRRVFGLGTVSRLVVPALKQTVSKRRGMRQGA